MTTKQPEALPALIERFRGLHFDHAPDGWPAVRTREITALLDRITELESQLAQRFDAADMATAAAQGFRDGVASLSANAGEPTQGAFQRALSIRTAQGWKLGGDKVPVLYTDEINGEQVCRDDVWLCTTDAFTHPSPPDGMAGWISVDAIALARYKVVPAHESMFHRFAVVAGDGKQQLYLGREVECENMARKFAGAFLDGAFYQANITPSTQAADSVQEPATVPRFNCWSTNECDSWFDHPADSQAIYDCLGNDAKVGDEYELTAGWKSVTARYRITEVVGDGEEYEVECISHPHENSAPQPVEREPLTDEQIKDLQDDGVFLGACRQIVRAIEAEHGIKGGQHVGNVD